MFVGLEVDMAPDVYSFHQLTSKLGYSLVCTCIEKQKKASLFHAPELLAFKDDGTPALACLTQVTELELFVNLFSPHLSHDTP